MCSVLASSIGTLLEDTLFRRETNLFEQTFRRVLLHGDTDDINPKVFKAWWTKQGFTLEVNT